MKAKVKKAPLSTQGLARCCNLCGARLARRDLQNRFHIDRIVGPGSDYHGQHIDLWMCCSCFDRLVEGSEITPSVTQIEATEAGME